MEKSRRNEFVLVHIQSLSSSIRVDTDRAQIARARYVVIEQGLLLWVFLSPLQTRLQSSQQMRKIQFHFSRVAQKTKVEIFRSPGSINERRSSMDTRRQTDRDSDVIIQIDVQESKEPCKLKEQVDHVNCSWIRCSSDH
ncbi:uncharacterized protein LOC141662015 [Apium graveolens]|uniref:uncharacterized protein LOC141662015 n=1 Tax=Apium graveolens TaxID=4045 RepID=UPI003D7B3597